MKRILCPIDFSESSRAAMHAAIALAQTEQAALVLLHVEERPLWVHEPYMRLPGDLRAELLAHAETQLETWRREALQRGASDVTTRLVDGAPWDRIVAAANDDPAIHVIVLGTHGRTGLKRALLGSVAERVVRHAPCSVMVVRPR